MHDAMRRQLRSLLLLFLLPLAGCGAEPAPARTAGVDATALRVRVTRGGTVLAAFTGAGASAVLDGNHLSIELASPDGAHRLAIEVDGSAAGTYALAPSFETARAVVLLVSHGTPGRISPDRGELRLSDSSDGRVSGAFAGSARDGNGYRYEFAGTFTAVPVRRL